MKGSQCKTNFDAEVSSGSEEGSYSRLMLLYHSTPGLRVIEKKKDMERERGRGEPCLMQGWEDKISVGIEGFVVYGLGVGVQGVGLRF